jgi:hypothetical protein
MSGEVSGRIDAYALGGLEVFLHDDCATHLGSVVRLRLQV